MAQTGWCRKRHQRKQGSEAAATFELVVGPVSWDHPWNDASDPSRLPSAVDEQRLDRLDADLIGITRDLVSLSDRASAERVKVAHLSELLVRKRELIDEITQAHRARAEAEQQTRAAERRLSVERQRVERARNRADGPRKGRPVRIDVDDQAWVVLRGDVVARRTAMIIRLGELARAEAELITAGQSAGRPASRRRRGPGESVPVPRRRFLRIVIDDDSWAVLRVAAIVTQLPVGRYVGEIAEAEAHRLGWRADEATGNPI